MTPPLQYHEHNAPAGGTGHGPRGPRGHQTAHAAGPAPESPADGSQWLVGPFEHAQTTVTGQTPPDAPQGGTAEHFGGDPTRGTPAAEGLVDAGSALRVAVAAVHGGAGASTVAAMLRSQGVAVEEVLPETARPDPGTVPLLVVRADASGTATLAETLLGWRAWFGAKPLLILVPDVPTGAPSQAARYRLRALSGDYSGPVRVPWLWALREADSFDQIATTKKASRAAAQLVDHITKHTHTK